MKAITIHLLFVLLLASCDRKLDEKTFSNNDITVSWYNISEITSVHDFVEVAKGHSSTKIMEANTGGIYEILINGDTIIIRTVPDLLVYKLADKAFNYHVKHDTSITTYE